MMYSNFLKPTAYHFRHHLFYQMPLSDLSLLPNVLPPLLYWFQEYWDKTNDVQFVRAHLATLETELEFWESRRSIQVEVLIS